MNAKPYFSIAIPTYNRAEYLKATIGIILEQTFKNFEIVVTDNASTDNTMQIVKSFKDKRVRYIRSNKNIGFPKNTKKAMLASKGKYIFTLGDDDFLLFNDTLSIIKIFLEKNGYGFLRINMLERNTYGPGLQKKIMNIYNNINLKAGSSSKNILAFCQTIDVGTISGLVFKNIGISSAKFIVSEVNPWFGIIVDNCKKYGGFFLSNRYVVITWPVIPKHQDGSIRNIVYRVDKDQLSHEAFNAQLFSLVSKNEANKFKKEYYHKLVWFLPVTKLYTNNLNLIKFAKRLIELEPSIRYSGKMWIIFILALIIPRQGWLLIRRFHHNVQNNIHNIQNLQMVKDRYQFLTQRYYIFANK